MRSQPSWTAQSVAMEILMMAEDKRFGYLVSEGVKETTGLILKTIPGVRGRFAGLARFSGFRKMVSLVERMIAPNKALYLALRKRWIEEQVKEALTNGIAQILIVGAGFDTLAYRLHQEYPDVMWIELDHPATQLVKKSALVECGHIQPNLQFVGCDLSYDPKLTALTGAPFYDCRKKTLYIVEGLLAYLDGQTASNIMKTLQKCGGVGSRLLGTMNARNGSPNPLVNLKLKLIGEPYRWGLAPELLPGYLRGLAWEASEIKKGQALGDRYLRKKTIIQIPEDEYLFSAIKNLGIM